MARLDFTSVPQFQGVQVKSRTVKGYLFELKETSIVRYIVPLQNTTVHHPSPSPSLSPRLCHRRHCCHHRITIVIVASVATIIAVMVIIASPSSRSCHWCHHPHHCRRCPRRVHHRLSLSLLAVYISAPPWLRLTFPPAVATVIAVVWLRIHVGQWPQW